MAAGPSRATTATRRRHRRTLAATAAVVLAVTAAVVWWVRPTLDLDRLTGQPTSTTIAPAASGRLPPACAEALALAAQLGPNAGALSAAVGHHLELMERLDLWLDHQPGGLSGHEVYVRGQTQMRTFADQGPKVRAQAAELRRALARCPR